MSIPRKHLLKSCFAACGLIAFTFAAWCGEATSKERSLAQLDPAKIPAELRFPDQPRELVAVLTLPRIFIGVVGIAFSPDGSRLAAGCGGGNLVVWNSGTLAEVASVKAHDLPIPVVVFSPDGKLLIDSCYDHTARLWEIQKGELREKATLKGHTDQIWGMSLTKDGKTLATASTDKTIRLWKIDDARPKQIMTIDNRESAWCVSIADDGKILACPKEDDITLWDIAGAEPKKTAVLTGHEGLVWRVQFAPGGKVLASTGRDKTARIWDVSGEKPVERFCLKGHDTIETYGLAFSPDGRLLVTADFDGRVICWDAAKGTELHRWKMPKGLRMVVFAPDGRHLAISCDSGKGVVYLLRLPA